MIRSAMAAPMPGSAESDFVSCSSMAVCHFFDRPDHRPQRLFDAHAIDRTKKLEELALDFGQKADDPRRHAALHRVAFEIFDGKQADLGLHLALQPPPRELGNQHFVLEGPDFQGRQVVLQSGKLAGDFGDHCNTFGLSFKYP